MTRERFGLVESLVILASTIGFLATGGALLQGRFGFWGLVPSELVAVAGPTVLALFIGRVAPAGVGLRRPSLRALAGGILVGAGGFYLVTAIVEASIEKVAPPSPELRASLHGLIGGRPLAVEIGVLAVLPALCEELVFRGALLESWRVKSGALAVLTTSIAFGAFHLDAYKLAPIVCLGALFGTVALRARSIFPSILAHATNNAIVVALVHYRRDDPPPIASGAGAALACASAVAIAAGIALARTRSGASQESPSLSA